jgi:hypothetical protein
MTRTEIIHAITEHEAVGEDHDELDGRLAYLDGAYFTWDAPSADFLGSAAGWTSMPKAGGQHERAPHRRPRSGRSNH